jgi:hypothetical protein
MKTDWHVDLLKMQTSNANVAILRGLMWLTVGAAGMFVTFTALRAVWEAYSNDGFPEALAIKVEMLPWIFPLHMITGGLALLLVPATILARRTAWHKTLGRLTATDVLVAGLTAPFVAWAAPVTFMSAAGFTAQSFVWMGLLGVGVVNIRRSHVAAHQTCMLLMAAVTSGALFFRIFLGLWAGLGSHHYFNIFYACDAWIAWALPLAAMSLALRFGKFSKLRITTKVHLV